MSTQRLTPEFKAEAVRQVVEPGYSVARLPAPLDTLSSLRIQAS